METVILIIDSRIELSDLPAGIAREFERDNTFPNPKRATLERLGKWAGNEPLQLRLWSTEDGILSLPRGYFPAVISKLRRAAIPFEIGDYTVKPERAVSIEESGALYPFQSRALENLLKRTMGVLEAPTGSGKTNILLSAVARLNTHSLILVHTSELLEQTCSRVRSWLGVEPGVIGGGRFELRPVTVAMVQTLARRDLAAEGIPEYFGVVLVDEVHHSPAVTWAAILNHLPAKYRYGFTATAWRKDGLQFLIWQLIGSRTARITRAEVQAAGRIIWPEFESVETDYFYPITDASQWGEMISDLVANEDRNHLIEVEIRKRLSAASRALVLCDRISHAGRLAELLEDLGPILLTGESTKSERQGGMVRVRQGARLTVATTHLLGEGVDVPGWDLLFLVSPIAGGTKTLQCIGRVTRPAAGKHQSRVVDFVDVSVPMLSKAYRSRMRLYG